MEDEAGRWGEWGDGGDGDRQRWREKGAARREGRRGERSTSGGHLQGRWRRREGEEEGEGGNIGDGERDKTKRAWKGKYHILEDKTEKKIVPIVWASDQDHYYYYSMARSWNVIIAFFMLVVVAKVGGRYISADYCMVECNSECTQIKIFTKNECGRECKLACGKQLVSQEFGVGDENQFVPYWI
ncbi:hypothetical protein Salat_1131100 [Sesamum alatum]|uniref:Uncharacterized protein n=1 Tax=Sesamum alatum TaxID=300844 RepID=A0AAE2CN64_9LAMI|nr:hypothetical protein Salat_1131100 [Sesamum alatum]